MANGIREGGVVEGNPSLYPSSSSEGEDSAIPGGGGSGRIGYTNGGAPTMNGSYKSDFMDDSSYRGDGEVSRPNPSNPKVCNPDDLSNSA